MMTSITSWPAAGAVIVTALCSLAKKDSPITRALASRIRKHR